MNEKAPMPAWRRIYRICRDTVLFAVGVVVTVAGVRMVVQARDAAAGLADVAESWVAAPAQIREATVSRSLSHAFWQSRTDKRLLSATFSYTFSGREYASSDLGWYTQRDAESLVPFSLQVGTQTLGASAYADMALTCRVNPADPAQAKLFCNPETASLSKPVAVTVFGLLIALGTAANLISSIRGKDESQSGKA